MRRWASSLFIAAYLGALGFGVFSHAFTFLKGAHPAMYFLVWDMYCGWSAYESRLHVLGEGESGRYYQLAPGPWSDFRPFGSVSRQNYDVFAQFGHRFAANALAHTQHEPIHRIVVVEESWAKKYNLPDELWALQYDVPKDPHSYFHVRSIYNPRGECLQQSRGWLTTQAELAILDNPRLRQDMRKGHTFFASHPGDRSNPGVTPVGYDYAAGQP